MIVERMPVGVVVERQPGVTKWQEHVWRAVAVLPGSPMVAPWTELGREQGPRGEIVRYYAGTAELVAYSGGDTRTYKHNIEAPEPSVYVVLRRADTLSGWTLYLATIDPAEAHSHADTGDDLVERLPMPPLVFDWLSAFVAQHHVERMEWKRKRDRADPDALGVRGLAAEEQRGRRQAGWEDEDE